MVTKPNKKANGIDVDLLRGNFKLVAKIVGCHPNYVRRVAHDEILLSDRDTVFVRNIIMTLTDIQEAILKGLERTKESKIKEKKSWCIVYIFSDNPV